MTQQSSSTFKFAYCIVLLSAILPFGLAKSGWVALATGGIGMGFLPVIGPLVFMVLGVYRVYLVAQVPGVLDAPAAAGLPLFCAGQGLS